MFENIKRWKEKSCKNEYEILLMQYVLIISFNFDDDEERIREADPPQQNCKHTNGRWTKREHE